MYDIGESPGKGRYCCNNGCGWSVNLDEASDVLPPCAIAGPVKTSSTTAAKNRLPLTAMTPSTPGMYMPIWRREF